MRAFDVPTPLPLPVLTRTAHSAPSVPPPAPAHVRSERVLRDSHGRTIRDLRLSLTDRCNFRCVYCMEPDVRFRPHEELLTPAEVARLARLCAAMGVRKVRLTGGEPTLRDDLEEIIARVRAEAPGVEIALITNGSLLTREALARWRRAGLRRVTISIDSLDPAKFARLTRSTSTPHDVLRAVDHCIAEGLTPLKLNAVLVRGFNDDEAPALAALARERALEMRFIEFMPLDSAHRWDPSRVVPMAETRAAIEERFPLVPTGDDEPGSTAITCRFADGAPGRIGFIAPVSSPFCGACSRLRITADAKVRPCLFSTTEWDLRPLLRSGATDDELSTFLIDATWTKQPGHGLSSPAFSQPERPMSAIGG